LKGHCPTLLYLVNLMVFLSSPADANVINISNHPQLFLDDMLVARMTNLERQVQKPVKHPANPLITQTLPWEKRLISIYGTALYDAESDKFRIWYTAGENRDGIPDNPEHPVTAEYFICYAESQDGIAWTKPLVSNEKFGLHDKHNIVMPHGHGLCVLATPDDPDPAKKFKAAGGATFGFSPDGIRWDARNWREAVGKNDTSTSVVYWKGQYLAFVRYQVKDPQWPGVMRGIGLCVSKDFETWTPKELIFTTDKEDGYPWTQPYGLPVTPYGDQLIGLLWLLRLEQKENNNSLGDEYTQLMVSRDGRKWQRVADRQVFLEPTPDTWDQGRIHAPATTMFVKDDQVYIYYSASETRHGSGSWGKPGIGLATLPADRFVALRQKEDKNAGILETPLLQLPKGQLLINANLNGGSLQVELLDAKGKGIPGFERSNSKLAKHDNLRYKVDWGENAGRIPDQPVALRFILNKAELFAFQVKANEQIAELTFKGNAYERGFQHGRFFAADISEAIAGFRGDLSNRAVLAKIEEVRTFLDEHFPEANEEIRGISDGAGVPSADVFLFNNRAIMGLVDSEECSDIALHAAGEVIVAMNKDRPHPLPAYDKYFVKKVYPNEGYAFIGYGHVGRLWGHGMNEKGLCTAGAAAHPLKNKPASPSLGSYLLPPLLLSKCKNVPEALTLLDSIEAVADSGNFMLCDASGEMVVVELTPHERIVRRPDSGRLIASTFFASGEISHRRNPVHLQESRKRFGVIRDLLNLEVSPGLATAETVLRSHREAGSVCRHEESGVLTVLSWIALPVSGQFYLCEGQPCRNDYCLYTL
jgi:predicted choloylglycine hydrolase